MIIFIDSGPFRAANDNLDQHHKKAMEGFSKLDSGQYKLVTTDYVIDETYTGLLGRPGYHAAMNFDRALRQSRIQVEFINPERFMKTQEVFRRYNKDKEWSFTDCTSYVVMKELKISTAFTFDQNFAQMGFKIL